MDFENCKTSAKFCSWKTLLDVSDVLVEYCEFCNRREIRKKHNGEFSDLGKFKREHIRDFCQPHGPTRNVYAYVYGYEAMERFYKTVGEKQRRADKAKEHDEAFDAEVKSWRKTTFYPGALPVTGS